jgi:predicted outer membrane repeat protein
MSSGGAIHSSGTLLVTDSTFHTNSVSNDVSQASGGAVFNIGQATITDSVFLYNTAVGNMVGEGGALSTSRIGTVLDVVRCSFVNNSASHSGGGIFAQGYLKLLHCQFENHSL